MTPTHLEPLLQQQLGRRLLQTFPRSIVLDQGRFVVIIIVILILIAIVIVDVAISSRDLLFWFLDILDVVGDLLFGQGKVLTHDDKKIFKKKVFFSSSFVALLLKVVFPLLLKVVFPSTI